MSPNRNAPSGSAPLTPGIPGFDYADLHDPARLADLLATFDAEVRTRDPALAAEFAVYRSSGGAGMEPRRISDLLVRMAPQVGDFVARLFQVEAEHAAQRQAIRAEIDSVFVYRNRIVGKLARRYRPNAWREWDHVAIEARLAALRAAGFPETAAEQEERAIAQIAVTLLSLGSEGSDGEAVPAPREPLAEVRLAALRRRLLEHPQARELLADCLAETADPAFAEALLEIVRRWSFLALHDPILNRHVRAWVSLRTAARRDVDERVAHETESREGFGVWVGPRDRRRRRDGFSLTDRRAAEREVLAEVDRCIYCHERGAEGGDSCAKGMRERDGEFRANALEVPMTGCPLGEKISEMHLLKRRGDNIAALALIIIDNPMCPGTGHRICNDCMKGCIYAKSEPVDIPQIETNVLTDVLFMPWGFEIYSLLTRWNPLNVERPHALPYNGRNVLVVGMGPAGYTLAHYLLNEGFGVVGIDALKIERVPRRLAGSRDTLPVPIRNFRNFHEDLDDRLLAGFGGVAEYGITVRWDKNFLRVIHLTLARRRAFRCYGGVRFGGTITLDDAWALGFDHVAVATGAGKPTLIDLENNLIRGVRMASDFLMTLQLSGAAKESSLANLQVRLPAGVIGGGLTAVDTATEVMAYYPRQVEKVLHRYEKLVALYGERRVRGMYDEEEITILDEFLAHGHAVQAERERARMAGEQPDFARLVERWGGVTLFYRKGIKDAPAYRQNHEEISKALEEGIALAEGMSPTSAQPDRHGALEAVCFERYAAHEGRWQRTADTVRVPLRSLFIAAGTSPNTIYEQEHPDTFELDGRFFRRYAPQRADGNLRFEPVREPAPLVKRSTPAPFTSYDAGGRRVTIYGDNHPVYAGNVVKAMASARDGYPYIVELFAAELARLDPAQQAGRDARLDALCERLDTELLAQVVRVTRLAPTILEVVVRAPMAARKFQPGQFYRVQGLEWFARTVEDTLLVSEGIALTGAWVDKDAGHIGLITLEMGASSRLCATWKPGDPVIVMGVTGQPTEIIGGQTVALVGGGLGNAVLFSIGKALRAAGSRVLYFAGYRRSEDVFKVEDIERAADVIVWSVDAAPGVQPIAARRAGDQSFVGNIVESIVAYGDLGPVPIPLEEIERMIVIGSDRMMAAVEAARRGVLAGRLPRLGQAIGSINSPMQCMMKGVCAQCLCRHVDPATGEEQFVYSCYNQDQPLERVDFAHLHERLRQNSVQEKLGSLWLQYLLERPATAQALAG
ncbi:MAG: FAD-dependent oxidoreductase [Gammaproteobacteria bacterium]|nr:FAD-dependent oxidoreductase [Gammaproteobacteria bacterium]